MMPSPFLAQKMLDNQTTAVLWFDAQLRLQAMNPAAENLLELSANQIYGVSAERLFRECECFLRLDNLQDPSPVTEHGLRVTLHSGQELTIDCSVTPVRKSSKQPPEAFLVEIVDVDQQLRLSREENLMLQRQAAQNILRGLAHEIKNPLGGLRGAAQLLARELPLEQREYTDIIIGEADRLQTLLDRMLGPRALPHKERLNVHRILCRTGQLVASEAGNGILIQNDFDPSIPDIYADPDQVYQAILNIARNAIQAMQSQGCLRMRTRVERRVILGNRQHKMALRIDIQDDGPGISEEILGQIFYPMVTGRAEGTGLGLSIAQTLVNQNDGLVSCSSKPGKTVFSIWFPLYHDAQNNQQGIGKR